MTEVRIVLMEPVSAGPDSPPNLSEVVAKAGAYELSTADPIGGGRLLGKEECGDDFDAFVETVCDDMDLLGYNLTMAHARGAKHQEATKGQVFMKLLLEFQDKPVEVLVNMLASVIAGCVDATLEEPDFDARVAQWESELKAAQEPQA